MLATGEELWRTGRLVITEKEGEEQFPAAEKVGASIDTSIGISAAGQGINFAPQVNDGKVFLSTSGQITGGEAIALDAKTGKVLWKLDETKEPADRAVGGIAGTAGSWNAPAIAPDGTVYYGIGNPYRTDNQAIKTPTELLYNDSTIAVDPETGKVKWYFQGVPNDFYDWDMQISPVYVEEDGENMILDAGKMGYVYAMDAETGELAWKTPVGTHNGHDEDGETGAGRQVPPAEVPVQGLPGHARRGRDQHGGTPKATRLRRHRQQLPGTARRGNDARRRPEPEESNGDMAAIDVRPARSSGKPNCRSVPFGAATVSNDLVFTTLYDGTVLAVNREPAKSSGKKNCPAAPTRRWWSNGAR